MEPIWKIYLHDWEKFVKDAGLYWKGPYTTLHFEGDSHVFTWKTGDRKLRIYVRPDYSVEYTQYTTLGWDNVDVVTGHVNHSFCDTKFDDEVHFLKLWKWLDVPKPQTFKTWTERLDTILVSYLSKLNAEGNYEADGVYYKLSYQVYPFDVIAWEEFKEQLGKNGLLIDWKHAAKQPMDYMDPEGKTWGQVWIRALSEADTYMGDPNSLNGPPPEDWGNDT